MNFIEIQSVISKKIGCKVSQTDIASALNVTRQNVNKRLKNNSELAYDEILALENYFQIVLIESDDFSQNEKDGNKNKILKLKYYSELSGKIESNTFILSKSTQNIIISPNCINNYMPQAEYFVLNANSDCMEPDIKLKDLLIIEYKTEKQITDNEIYIFYYNNQFFIKRLIRNINELIIKSDNEKSYYKVDMIEKKDMDKIYIIGKIVGLIRKF